MMAVPTSRASTTPLESTRATEESLLLQVILAGVMSSVSIMTVAWMV